MMDGNRLISLKSILDTAVLREKGGKVNVSDR